MLKPEDFDGAADRMVEIYSRIETGAVIRKTLSVQLFPGCLATNFFASNTFMFSSFSN